MCQKGCVLNCWILPPNMCMIHIQTSNDYIREWLGHKDEFLQTLLDLEGPPASRQCVVCNGDGIYRCCDCFGQPLLCSLCCREQHRRDPFHRIQQWTGYCFDECSLNLVCDPFSPCSVALCDTIHRPDSDCISVMTRLHARSGSGSMMMTELGHITWKKVNGWMLTKIVFPRIFVLPHTLITSPSLTSLGSISSQCTIAIAWDQPLTICSYCKAGCFQQCLHSQGLYLHLMCLTTHQG
jgi:hypothetical protein